MMTTNQTESNKESKLQSPQPWAQESLQPGKLKMKTSENLQHHKILKYFVKKQVGADQQ